MKKIIALLLVVIMSVTFCFCLTGCDKDDGNVPDTTVAEPTPTKTMVVIGDSIAEAILGPSPLSERENYGYYALLGRRNNYTFYNRSVSGHKSAQMLEYISAEDNGAIRTSTLIKEADIISVSILGNDMLQMSLGSLVLQYVTNDMSKIQPILDASTQTFAAIVAKLKELNPDALILVQTIYNPISPTAVTVSADVMDSLADLGYDTEAELRDLGNRFINELNDIIRDYAKANPGDITVVDVWETFNDIYNEDSARGNGLIFNDGVHPSNEGHAVIADCIQAVLDENGLSDTSADVLRRYKAIKVEQLNRMYSSTSVDVTAAIAAVNAATTCADITKAYFAAIGDTIPVYTVHADFTAGKTYSDRFTVANEETLSIYKASVSIGTSYDLLTLSIINTNTSYIKLRPNGTMTIRLMIQDSATTSVGSIITPQMLESLDLESALEMYVRPLFPGFTMSDLNYSINLLPESLGLGFVGLDLNDAGIKPLIDFLQGNGDVPESIVLPKGVGIEVNCPYYLKTVTTDQGTAVCLCMGGHADNGEPFAVMTYGTAADGVKKYLQYRCEFIGIDLEALEK